uniref:Secreted protein n=1 Tax=Heterorhabditis bacteriophora TaxID=37862 RepID=A0A1I7WQ47_HETBA
MVILCWVRRQNDLPTSLSSKWSFLFNWFHQISQLTTLVLVHKTAHPSYPTRCIEELFWRECSALPWMLSAVRGLPMNVFLRCLASNEMQMLSRRPMLFSESSYGTHFPSLRIFPISCNRLETVALSTPSCSASSSWVCDGFSSNNDSKASVLEVRGISERCRSLTSKSAALKRRNQYLEVPWERTASPSTEHVDLHASAAFFSCWNSQRIQFRICRFW